MNAKTLTRQLMALLLSLCLLLSGVTVAAGEETLAAVEQETDYRNSVAEKEGEDEQYGGDDDSGDRIVNESVDFSDNSLEVISESNGDDSETDSNLGDIDEETGSDDIAFGEEDSDSFDTIIETTFDEGDEEAHSDNIEGALYAFSDFDEDADQDYTEEDDVNSDYFTKTLDNGSGDTQENEASASVEDGALQVTAGDVGEGGVSVSAVADGSDSDIRVVIGDEPIVDEVDVSVGDVTDEDYGIGVSAYDYDDEADIDVTVSAGDVTVSGESGATGVAIYDYDADVDVSTGDVSVDGGEGESVGIDVTVEGESQVDIEVQGDVAADGESGAGIRIQGTEIEGGTEESQVSVVVTGTISGTDAAIQVSEDMAENTEVTAWAVEENEDGELAQVIDADGEVNEEASSLFERAIQYIVMVAEEFKNRLSVSTGHTVTVGKGDEAETYQTAAEGEEVMLQVTLGRNEVLRGVYYNEDEGTEAEYTQDGDNFFIKMLREGAMLLGLDIGRKEPEPMPAPMPIEYDEDNDDDDEHHSHSTRSSRTEFVYIPVAKNIQVHGVTAADNPTAQWVAHTVSAELNSGYRYVDIQNKEVLMNNNELAQFDALSLEDRMLVMMAAMSLNDTAGDFRASMSDAARALAAEIDSRVAMMSDSERAARMDEVNVFFPPRLVNVNGAAYEGVGIVLIINNNGSKSYERYTFYDADGVWKLHQIEEGKYVVVD